MEPQTARRLLELNRAFYATVAEPFNQTRYADSRGKARLLAYLEGKLPPGAWRVLDAGCGNGRLAWMLERLQRPIDYVGVDGEPRLLALARENTGDLQFVKPAWQPADLAAPHWRAGLGAGFTVAFCLATLQHLPGFDLRARVVADLAAMVQPHGRVALSAWQFLTTERLAARQLEWQNHGIDPAHVEPGDALLPWRQGRHAVRYVHQIDQAEMARLAVAAGLAVEHVFYADGREGNLNLYAVLAREGEA